MADGLAVRADGRDRCRAGIGEPQQRCHAFGIDAGERVGGQRLTMDLVVAWLLQGAERLAQWLGEGRVGRRQHDRVRAGKIDEHAVRAIHAGARHQADKSLAACRGHGHGQLLAVRTL
ncbi:hypothetical protein D3C87_1072730 [compost metagenome]